ncbi:MAG: cardiolipin synthase [Bacteroidales bacterium]|nr:cardiolipin synthase [Bacteroidales bacterium]
MWTTLFSGDYYWFGIIYLITVLFIVVLIIQQKGDPLKTITWSLVLLLIPIVGIILYFYFGQNYRRQKIFNRKGLSDMERMRDFSHLQILELPKKSFLKNPKINSKQHIITLLINNSKSLLSEKNKLQIFSAGKEAFEYILNDIASARHHIHLEYYIIEDDNIGRKVRDLLISKAKEGVEVRVIYDDVGSWKLSKKYIEPLKNAGVEIYPFLPVRFPYFTNKINYRNHRKIVVIDGLIAHVGGMNIADRYIDGVEGMGQWKDMQLRIEGEAVHSLQVIFLTDWYFVSNQALNDDKYFPAPQVNDVHLVQIITSGPDSDWASIMQAYFAAITTANDHIYIATPYFIPNESILTALKTAALGGVDVKIMLPFQSDSRLVYWSTLSFVGELLEAGVHIYFYHAGFNHAKLMLVDGIFASVGTANMDIRSFDQNFEVNAIIYDEEITQYLENLFLADIEDCYTYSLDEWNNRPWWLNFRESFARLMSPLF